MNVQKTEGYIYPKDFFGKNKMVISEGLAFVMMPFGNPMDKIYEDVISKTLRECGLTSLRADEVFDTKPIMISIMQKINEAELIIAEVTGRNANVFYELGMAHVLKDKVILITQNQNDIPFDLQHFRYILYEDSPEGHLRLRESLMETLTAIGLRKSVEGEVSKTHEPIATAEEAREPLSTRITFSTDEPWNNIKGRIFAEIVEWVDFDEVKDEYFALKFPGGTFSYFNDQVSLTLQPGGLQLKSLLEAFGLQYKVIQYNMDSTFDIGDLVKRSRGNVRWIDSVTQDSITFVLSKGLGRLTVKNTGQGSSIIVGISRDLQTFRPSNAPISFAVVMKYLEQDPPTEELEENLVEATK
jgi:hypothetical protein